MCKNFAKGENRIFELVVQVLSFVTYLINVSKQGVWKRHVNQLIDKINKK